MKMINITLLLILINLSNLFAIEHKLNVETFENHLLFSDLQNNRILYKLNTSKTLQIDQLNYNTEDTQAVEQTNFDSTRIKWEYLGPFIGATLITNISIYYIFRNAYWNEQKTKFHTFNDWNNADMNIDKIGHVYAGILLTKASYKVLKETNVPENYSVIFSTLSSIFFQTQVEIHDAHFKKWGWSWWDFGANVIGAVYPHLQEYISPLKTVNLKWSYHPSPAYKNGWHNHWIKDYEGFTYYLTFDVNAFLPQSIDRFWPDWLNIAIAYGVEKVKLGKNIWNMADKPLGDREWYIALDYSLLKIFRPKSKILRDVLEFLDNFHFPAPAVRISPSTIWYGLYF